MTLILKHFSLRKADPKTRRRKTAEKFTFFDNSKDKNLF